MWLFCQILDRSAGDFGFRLPVVVYPAAKAFRVDKPIGMQQAKARLCQAQRRGPVLHQLGPAGGDGMVGE